MSRVKKKHHLISGHKGYSVPGETQQNFICVVFQYFDSVNIHSKEYTNDPHDYVPSIVKTSYSELDDVKECKINEVNCEDVLN